MGPTRISGKLASMGRNFVALRTALAQNDVVKPVLAVSKYLTNPHVGSPHTALYNSQGSHVFGTAPSRPPGIAAAVFQRQVMDTLTGGEATPNVLRDKVDSILSEP